MQAVETSAPSAATIPLEPHDAPANCRKWMGVWKESVALITQAPDSVHGRGCTRQKGQYKTGGYEQYGKLSRFRQ